MKIGVPDDHQVLVSTPGGPKCATCRYADKKEHACSQVDYQKAEFTLNGWSKKAGDSALPPDEKLEDMCSDWWEKIPDSREKLINTIKARKKQ